MEKNTIGMVIVPSAGLSIGVSTYADRPKKVQLQVRRHGLPFNVELTMAETDALAMALAMAYSEALSDSPVGVVL